MHLSHGAYFTCMQCETCHVMPHGVTCAVNPYDVMCALHNMCMLVSQASLCYHDAPKYTFWHSV